MIIFSNFDSALKFDGFDIIVWLLNTKTKESTIGTDKPEHPS